MSDGTPALLLRSGAPEWRREPLPVSGEPSLALEKTTTEPCWLLRLCISLAVLPREDCYSDSDTSCLSTVSIYEPSPVRLEALQVLALLVKSYFILAQSFLLELGEVACKCMEEADPSLQLHGAKVSTNIHLMQICSSRSPWITCGLGQLIMWPHKIVEIFKK
uniref:Uncharacterized protein n=2 Tax=Micrurus spixii TaxID=129469 RepID=A0A2D4MLJ4_9SAUR